MSERDKLRRGNEDGENIVSVFEPTEAEDKTPQKTENIFSVIMASIKQDNAFFKRADGSLRMPNLGYFYLSVIMASALVLLVVILNFVVGYKMLIPIVSFLLVLITPILSIVFFNSLNVNGKIGEFAVFFSFLFGFVIYVILNFISSLLYRFVAKEIIEQFGFPVVFSFLVFLTTFIMSNSFKTSKVSDCFLIAVTVAMGYCFSSNLVGTFGKLFVVSGSITAGSYVAPPGAGVIINTSDFLKENYAGIFDDWFFDYFALPFMYGCWAVVEGALVSYASESRQKKREIPRSVYLLIMLVIALNIFALWDTSVYYLTVIVKIVAFVTSTVFALLFINAYIKELSKTDEDLSLG